MNHKTCLMLKTFNPIKATNNKFVPPGDAHDIQDINQASFIKKGLWTAHLEGYFLPPNDGFYSFVVASSHKGRLFFSQTGCKEDALMVATVSDSHRRGITKY